MATVTQELDDFYAFAEQRLRSGEGGDRSLDEIYLEWRAGNPSGVDLGNDVLPVRAALRDMDRGETGRHFEEFATEFRARNGI